MSRPVAFQKRRTQRCSVSTVPVLAVAVSLDDWNGWVSGPPSPAYTGYSGDIHLIRTSWINFRSMIIPTKRTSLSPKTKRGVGEWLPQSWRSIPTPREVEKLGRLESLKEAGNAMMGDGL